MIGYLLASALVASAAPLGISVKIEGSLETSLSRPLGRDGVELAAQAARLLRWRGDVVRNLHRGDVLTLVYSPGSEEARRDVHRVDMEGAQAELVAMSYRGLEVSLSAYRFVDADGVARYFDERGVLVEPGIKDAPVVRYTQITELVQSGRGRRKHAGIDFKAPIGRPVKLQFDGVVSRVNWSTRVNGNCVEVAMSGGRSARFLHLSKIEAGVRPGARLAAGAVIGAVGNTGRSTSPHLHYEIRDAAGQPLAPEKIHGTTTVSLSSALKDAFEKARFVYDRRIMETERQLAVLGAQHSR